MTFLILHHFPVPLLPLCYPWPAMAPQLRALPVVASRAVSPWQAVQVQVQGTEQKHPSVSELKLSSPASDAESIQARVATWRCHEFCICIHLSRQMWSGQIKKENSNCNMPHNWADLLSTDLFVLTNPYLDDLGCEREKGHERGLREIHQLDPVWTLGSFWTLECKANIIMDI